MITTDRVRNADGTIAYITSGEAKEIHGGTIIRLYGSADRFDVYRSHTTPWGETQLINYHGEIIRLSDTCRVMILGHFNI
jgi:hypothetical protein